jgi:hypothetical protein
MELGVWMGQLVQQLAMGWTTDEYCSIPSKGKRFFTSALLPDQFQILPSFLSAGDTEAV